MTSLEQWIKDFPVITRTYVAAALLTTAACSLEMLSPYVLYFSWTLIWEKLQVWRLVTNFFFFGSQFTPDFLFHMFFLVQYCKSLEEGSFRGRTADFFWMILLGASALTVVAPFLRLTFLGSSLTFMMVYVWARRNPFVRMSFLGLFTFTAPYLPWVLLTFSLLLGHDVIVDVLGITIGHFYYFLEDVYPLMISSRKRILQTPRVIELLFSSTAAGDGGQVIFDHQFAVEQQIQQQQQQQQQQDGGAQAGEPDQLQPEPEAEPQGERLID